MGNGKKVLDYELKCLFYGRNLKCNNIIVFNFICSRNATNLERFQLSISKKEMYSAKDTLVDSVVQDMIQLPIQHVGK